MKIKIKIKYIYILLCVLVIFLLSSCGGFKDIKVKEISTSPITEEKYYYGDNFVFKYYNCYRKNDELYLADSSSYIETETLVYNLRISNSNDITVLLEEDNNYNEINYAVYDNGYCYIVHNKKVRIIAKDPSLTNVCIGKIGI